MFKLVDPVKCRAVTDKYPDNFSFNVEKWLDNKNNLALISDDNVGLAEYKSKGVYWIHFCFNSARGKEAISLAKQMIKYLLKERGFNFVMGPVEETNRAAKVVVRKIGFKSLGKENTDKGLFEMFFLTKNEVRQF